MHCKGIMHRNLTTENIVVEQDGYIKIIDFGYAKMMQDNEVALDHHSGTPEYKAPELVRKQAHDKTVDWWAVGIIIYEMLIGITPFFDKRRQVLTNRILHESPKFPSKSKYKIEYSDEIVDLIQKLLEKEVYKRLGTNNDHIEIMQHSFFQGISEEDLQLKQTIPPIFPLDAQS